jgi:hypothetical protein
VGVNAAPWTAQPGLVPLLSKLNELSARIARLEALSQVQRTTAVVQAFQNRTASHDLVRQPTQPRAASAFGGTT